MIIFWVHWLNKILELIAFYFFLLTNVAIRKVKIIYEACNFFPLVNTALE